MLDIDNIRQLVDMMVTNDLVEISLRDGDVEVSLRRPTVREGGPAPTVAVFSPTSNPGGNTGTGASATAEPPAEGEGIELVSIKSPMVGTFYAASDPASPPCVEVGSHVNPDTVVCVVEAMKVFNEIKAEIAGTVEKILVKNEQPIEYGQPLFLVRPD